MISNTLCHTSDPGDFIRLFVLVRTDIPYEHQAVQAGHAALEYVLNNPLTAKFNKDPSKGIHNRHLNTVSYAFVKKSMYDINLTIGEDGFIGSKEFKWNNGTLIYLAVENELELIKWQKKLTKWNIKSSMFEEPDWVDRLVPTALASLGFKGDFRELPLLRMPKGFFASKCKSEPLVIK